MFLQAAEEKAAKTATELKSKKDDLVKAEQDLQACQCTAHHHFCIHSDALMQLMSTKGRLLTFQWMFMLSMHDVIAVSYS